LYELLRILLIIKNFDFGGAENHVRELANSLADAGEVVHVVGAKGRQISLLNKNVQYISLRIRSALLPLQLFYLINYVIKHKIQVIHAHQRLPILLSCLAGKITGIPVIATVHGRTRFDLSTLISRKYPARIIFVSRHVLDVSAKYDEIRSKSAVISNWVSLPGKQPGKIPYSISYVSRIDRKHSALIILIIKKVFYNLAIKYPLVSFRIIGEGDFLESVRTEAAFINKKLNREACIICGFVLDVKEIIHQSDLIIGVGRVALEAMACGIPVLSMNHQRMGSLISRENYLSYKATNFVAAGNDPPDEMQLINVLSDFFNNLEFWQNEASELKKLITRDYDPAKITGEIIEIYRSVIDQKID
jgi:glycosyltransferase involved in cell wall biosynthesis